MSVESSTVGTLLGASRGAAVRPRLFRLRSLVIAAGVSASILFVAIGLVYLFCYLPAEAYVGLTGDTRGGIDIYGLLFFGSQAIGLAATFAADRSKGRII